MDFIYIAGVDDYEDFTLMISLYQNWWSLVNPEDRWRWYVRLMEQQFLVH